MDPTQQFLQLQLQQLQKNLKQSEFDLANVRREMEQQRRWIIGIGQAFVPETFAEPMTADDTTGHARIENAPASEIVALIMRALTNKVARLSAFTVGLNEEQQQRVLRRILNEEPTTWLDDPQLAQARVEIEQERARREAAETRAREAEARVHEMVAQQTKAAQELLRLRGEIQTLQAQLATSKTAEVARVNAPARHPPSVSVPSNQDDVLLFIMATRGLCEQGRLIEILRREFGVEAEGAQLFRHLGDRLLIETVNVRSETGTGRATNLVRLSGQGKQYTRDTLNIEPVPSELDRLLERNDTLEHVLLILQTRTLFAEKYPEPIAVLDVFPEPIYVDGGKRSEPDLTATLHDGRVLLIECERETLKDQTKRFDKWTKYFQATRGEFYIVCPNAKTVSALASEIGVWHNGHGGRVRVRITSIAQVVDNPTRFWAYDRTMG